MKKTDDDMIALIDTAMANMQRVRGRLASEQKEEPDIADDFSPESVITASMAAHRVGVSKQTIRRWAKDHGIGYNRGGRLIISIPRLRRHIGDA